MQGVDEQLAEEDAEGRFTPTRLAGKFPEPLESGDKLHMTPSQTPDRTMPQAWVGNQSIPNRQWEDNATGSGGRPVSVGSGQKSLHDVDRSAMQQGSEQPRADVGQWHPRMRRFEDVLRKNCVDVTASCPSCAPAKDKAA